MWKMLEDSLPPIMPPQPNLNREFPTTTGKMTSQKPRSDFWFLGWQPPMPEKSAGLPYNVRRNHFHELAITEEQRGDEMYDLNFDNRYEDEWDKMMRNRDPSRDLPLTHLDGCEGKDFR